MRLQGAAAVARMPVATYLKWLLRGSPVDGMSKHMTAILAHLDEISVAIARLSGSPETPRWRATAAPLMAPRDLITKKLQKRGIPSSTIRQVNAVLDELEAGR